MSQVPGAATPCPVPSLIPQSRRRLSTLSSAIEEDTAELEYTHAFAPSYVQAPPRKRQVLARRAREIVPITIFEDEGEGQELVMEESRPTRANILLAKPARRAARASLVVQESREEPQSNGSNWHALREIGQARRRASILPKEPKLAAASHEIRGRAKHEEDEKSISTIDKKPRRRTIYVPPDDTTILTIHPGANNADRLNDTFALFSPLACSPRQEHARQDGMHAEAKKVLPPKRTRLSLAAALTRTPLNSLNTNPSALAALDVPGQDTGKENNPPHVAAAHDNFEKDTEVALRPLEHQNQSPLKISEAAAASQVRHSRGATKAGTMTAKASAMRKAKKSTSTSSPPNIVTQAQKCSTARPKNNSAQSKLSPVGVLTGCNDAGSHNTGPQRQPIRETTRARQVLRIQQYPVLSEDVSQPDLYEDSWHDCREIALTQLINDIFTRAQRQTRSNFLQHGTPRQRFIKIYHQADVAAMHKRIHASLRFGTLAPPKDSSRLPSMLNDLGLRRRYLSLWLDSYDEMSLQAAVEVVVGRQLPLPSRLDHDFLAASEQMLDPEKQRRALTGLLEAFFVDIEESPISVFGAEHEEALERWQKTTLRSLMLVWLLDQAKRSGEISGCLFKPASARKSSMAVINALANMLLPSTGDVLRALRHLDFEVHHTQDPLQEVKYQINNIATDLRDGILLTHLVEVLLCLPKRFPSRYQREAITVGLHDATRLQNDLLDSTPWRPANTLSQQLKMPCTSRALRIHNVQIALRALSTHDISIYAPSTAVDIVDGHREKTLCLLWALVSGLGLAQLVDWAELIADTRRMKQCDGIASSTAMSTATDLFDFAVSPCDLWKNQAYLLQSWATAYGERSGLAAKNLTTSFADGKIYQAIADSIKEFMPIAAALMNKGRPKAIVVEESLQSIDCSTLFIEQLTATRCSIPSRDTTLANLAFLASIILPLARRHHAACAIQRAFRRSRSKVLLHQRVILIRIAHDCARIMETRNELIAAATTLQRRWRLVLDARSARLSQDVDCFQSSARGWLVRRRVTRAYVCSTHV